MVSTHLFLEGYGSETRKRLAELIDQAKKEDLLAPVTLVVPSMYTGLSVRRSLGEHGGLINVRFMVIPRLTEYLGSTSLTSRKKLPLTPTIKLAAVRHFAEEMAAKEPLGQIAKHPPLHDYLLNTFNDFAMLSQEQKSLLKNKSQLLSQVVEWHNLYKELTQPYYDREELAISAASTVAKGDAESVLKDMGFIIFYLATGFSPGELSLISSLGAQGCCYVILGLTGEEEVDSETYKLASQLEPVLGKPVTKAPNAESYTADHIVIAPDAYEETRWAIRHILKCAESNVPFHRMALLYRNSDPYAEIIKSQLKLADIPAAGPDPANLRDSAAGKLILHLINVFESDFARDSVMRWIAEAPVNNGNGKELTSQETALWEEISGKAGIISSTRQWYERLDRFCNGLKGKLAIKQVDEDGNEASKEGHDEIRLPSAIRLKLFIQKLSGSLPPATDGSWKDYSEWALRMLEQYANPKSWLETQSSSYERVTKILDELGRLVAIEPGSITLAYFRQTLDDCLKASSGRLGTTGEGVFVGQVGAAQGMEFDWVHIMGMVEGVFPPKLFDDAIIPDQYRKELGSSSPLALRDQKRIEERRLFKAALAAGSKRILSYPRSGSSGQRKGYPSPWLVDEANILYRKLHSSTVSENTSDTIISAANLEEMDDQQWLSVVRSIHDSLLSLGDLVPADTYDYDMHSLANWHSAGHKFDNHYLLSVDSTLKRALKAERAALSTSFTVWDGNVSSLSGESRRLGLPGETAHSPTRLELWAKCPFHYYLQNVLYIPVLDLPEEALTISAMDRGSLMHGILEGFIKALQENGKLPGYGEPWVSEHITLLIDMAEEEFTRAEALGITGRPLLWNVAKKEMRDDLSLFLKKDSEIRAKIGTRPIAVESRFGTGGKDHYPPVILDMGKGQQISFKGIIDRVDADASGSKLFIIDYKTGSSYAYRDMKDDPLGKGTHLQLPVYALAVKSRFGQESQIEAEYWFVSARRGFEKSEMIFSEELERNFKELLNIIVSGIEGGLFPANPGSGGEGYNNCTYCDYERVCPTNRDIAWEKKSPSPELTKYLTMTGRDTTGEIE